MGTSGIEFWQDEKPADARSLACVKVIWLLGTLKSPVKCDSSLCCFWLPDVTADRVYSPDSSSSTHLRGCFMAG